MTKRTRIFDLTQLNPRPLGLVETTMDEDSRYTGQLVRRLEEVLCERYDDPRIGVIVTDDERYHIEGMIGNAHPGSPPTHRPEIRMRKTAPVSRKTKRQFFAHELGHIADSLLLDDCKRDQLLDVYCKHEPRHPWSQPGVYADMGEQITEGFTWAFFPSLYDDYDGWPHPTPRSALPLIRELMLG